MSEWTWEFEGYDPDAERLRESLCTLGNGFFATRGAVPESRAGLVHYPATCAAGVYNRLESTVAGRRVVNEDLVNLPNWLLLRFRLRSADGSVGPWFSPDARQPFDYRHTLDLRRATLTRTFRYWDDEARRGVPGPRLLGRDLRAAEPPGKPTCSCSATSSRPPSCGTCYAASATTWTTRSGAGPSTTTSSAPATAPPSAAWSTPGSSRGSDSEAWTRCARSGGVAA